MTDRIDEYLDGAIERGALTADERVDADALHRAIDETRTFVDARPTPDLATSVLRRIDQLGLRPAPTRPHSVLGWLAASLWTPRQIYLRPAYGMLAVAANVLLIVFSPYSPLSSVGPDAGGEPRLFVQFRLQAPDASSVRLAGSFTDWQPRYELHETAPGIWTVTLPLSSGVHDYGFLVDGQRWVPDPYAQHVDDGFGGTNSRIALLLPETPRS